MPATMVDALILNWLTDHDTEQAEATLGAFATVFATFATKAPAR